MTVSARSTQDLRRRFSFTRDQLDMLIDSLTMLIEMASKPPVNKYGAPVPEQRQGICQNWEEVLQKHYPSMPWRWHVDGEVRWLTYVLVSKLSPGWPQHNHTMTTDEGENLSPVPERHRFMWNGQVLAYRLSLMRYLRKRLRDWKRRTPV